jgi:hypothetical protein
MNAKEVGSRLLAEVEETNLHEVGEASVLLNAKHLTLAYDQISWW